MDSVKDRSKTYVIQCLTCGTTYSIDKAIIAGLHKEIYDEHLFEIDHSHLKMKGFCKRCKQEHE